MGVPVTTRTVQFPMQISSLVRIITYYSFVRGDDALML